MPLGKHGVLKHHSAYFSHKWIHPKMKTVIYLQCLEYLFEYLHFSFS